MAYVTVHYWFIIGNYYRTSLQDLKIPNTGETSNKYCSEVSNPNPGKQVNNSCNLKSIVHAIMHAI